MSTLGFRAAAVWTFIGFLFSATGCITPSIDAGDEGVLVSKSI